MFDIKKTNGNEIIQTIHGLSNKFFSIEKSIYAYVHGVVYFFHAALEIAKKHRGAKRRWWKWECLRQYKTALFIAVPVATRARLGHAKNQCLIY